MFSLFLLTAFGGSDTTARRLASSEGDRRRLSVSSLGLENVECHETATSFTWTNVWNSDNAGSFAFEAPYTIEKHVYVFVADSGSWPTYSENQPCWDCTASTAPDDDKALVLEPPSWMDLHTEPALYMNFLAAGPGLSNVNLYFCWHVPSFKIYWEPTNDLAGTVTSLAGFLAQASWETGTWAACDEENHTGWKTAACTQKEHATDHTQDLNQLYHELTTSPHSCSVTTTMSEIGTTPATKVITETDKELPVNTWKGLECKEGTDTEKCCWWGRGSIQLTGPSNYGNLQNDIIKNSASLGPDDKNVDLCANPGDICNDAYPSLKFVSGLYYWVTAVQSDSCFDDTRKAYLEDYDVSTEDDTDSNGCVPFAWGIGGQVNMGSWNSDHVHGQKNDDGDGRVPRFKSYMLGDQDNDLDGIKKALEDYDATASNNPSECTGNTAVDTIFDNADLKKLVGLDGSGLMYTWDGFCTGLKEFL